MQGIPFIGIAIDPKVSELSHQLGQLCFEPSQLLSDDGWEQLVTLFEKDSETYTRALFDRRQMLARLAYDYEEDLKKHNLI